VRYEVVPAKRVINSLGFNEGFRKRWAVLAY